MAHFEPDPLTEKIIGCCFAVHKAIGPGFNEKIYHNALRIQLQKSGLKFESEKEFSVNFEGHTVGKFRSDLYVENKVIIELKAVTGPFVPVLFQKQLLSYLKASQVKTGLLINFGNASCDVKRLSL